MTVRIGRLPRRRNSIPSSTRRYRRRGPGSHRSPLAMAVFAVIGVATLLGAGLGVTHARAATAPAGFRLSLSPSTQTVAPGARATYTVRVTRTRFTTPVRLTISGVPSGSSVRASANPINNSATMAVIVPDTAREGRYRITVRGAAGRLAQSVTGTIVVSASATAEPTATGAGGVVSGGAAGLPTTVGPSTTATPAATTTAPSAGPTTTAPAATTIAATTTVAATTTTLPQDFSMTVGPASQTVKPGGAAVYSVSIARTGGFTQPLDLNLTGQPNGVSFVFSPNPAGDTSSLNVLTEISTPPGNYELSVNSRSRTARFRLVVSSGLGLTSSTLSQTVAPGSTANYPLVLARAAGAPLDPATMAVSGLPAGVTAAFAPNPVSVNTTLTLTVPATVPVGTYQLSVSASAAGLQDFMALSLIVAAGGTTTVPAGGTTVPGATTTTVAGATSTTTAAGGFNMTAAPAAVNVATGGAATFAIDIISPPQAVQLGIGGIPTGATAVFAANPSAAPTSLVVTTTSATPQGTYPLTITGVAGTAVRSAVVNLIVGGSPGFALSANPGTVQVARGAAAVTNIALAPSGGFAGQVTFEVTGTPPNVTTGFTAVTSSAGTSLILAPQASAAVGTSTLTITGVSGNLRASIQLTLIVT